MPKGMDNATLIIEAARELFLEHGYAATSMDVVAQRAGVSKATVYARFESKERLFADMIEREGERQHLFHEITPGTAIADSLEGFATAAAALLLSPSNVAMSRIVSSEATRSPEIGQLFYANGPAKLIDRLAAILSAAMERGELRLSPPRLAATQFLAIIVADLQLRLSLGLAPPRPKEQRAIVAAGVQAFLHGHGAR